MDLLLLAALGAALFAWLAPRAGLHLDDYGFWADFENVSPARLLELTVQYVPGRNLYIPFFYALQRLCAGSPAAMHLAGAALDVVNTLLFLVLARRLGAGPGPALAAAGLFLAWPNHGETHWWTSAIMMNLFSTTLVLGAVLLAGETRLARGARLGAAAALFTLALFDYDQVYLLWLPLLAFARLRDRGLTPRVLAAWAGGFVFLDALHLTARLFSPWSNGGRPMPHAGLLWHNAVQALAATLAPLRRNPVLADFPGGLLPALVLALGLGALWAWRCSRRWERAASAEPVLAAFGGAWWLLSYAPNFLWYISPRHNYLPSAGVALLAAALAGRLSAVPRLRRGLVAAGAGLFALFTLSAWSDGLAWADATARHERFAADATAAALPPNAAVFLLGAPRDVRTAPGFSQPGDPLGILRRAGLSPAAADITAAPNRLGVFYGGERALFGEDARPAFAPLASSALFFARDGGFACARIVRVHVPGLPPRPLKPGQGRCAAGLDLDAPLALVSSRSLGRAAPAPEGPALESAALAPGPGGALDLRLVWRAGAAPEDFAAHLRLLDASGRVLWLSTRRPSPVEYEAFWPLYDDELPASSWRPGERIAQLHRLRAPASVVSAASARLTLFTRRQTTAWTPTGTRTVRLEGR